jgi:site-specific recombinase XerC
MDKAAQNPLIRSFERHLRAENRSERTIATYLIGLRQADAFLRAHGTTPQAATRADLEAFLADLLTRRSASTAATYYKPLKLLYAWLVEEEEIPADPMRRMKRPIVPDKPVPIVPADGLKRLLRACAGNTFEARRDTALLMLLLDTGARRDEIAGGPAVVVEDAGAEDKLADEVGSLQRGQQRHRCPVAVAQQGGRAADDLLEEGDRVLGHERIGDGALDVGGAPVTAPVGPEDVEVLGELGHIVLEGPRVRQSGVQEHQRLARAVLLVVGVHVAELCVVGHLLLPLVV